jgi:polyribonucleotide nucleotidyltransferase
MFNTHSVQKEIDGKLITLETGRIARQAHGAVIASCGQTMVLAAVCVADPRDEEIDYFPLSVDYREKYSAVGKFPGGFMKREGRPTTKEILTARMMATSTKSRLWCKSSAPIPTMTRMCWR